MDYIESMKFTRDDILVAFQVPKPIVAIVDDVNRANSETAMAIFLGETIKPEISRITEKINEQLIYPDFGEEFYVDFDDPTPDNRDLQLKEYSEGIQNNYLLINEVRAREGLEPIRGGWSFYMPIMNAPMGGLSTSDQKALFKKVMDIDDSNKKIIESNKKVKTYNFKGRYWLKQKFELYETMEKAVGKALEGKKIKTKKKKGWVSLIKDLDMRNNYADMINKKIDTQGEKLKDGASTFFKGQMHRVLGELSKKKGKAARAKLKGKDIFKFEKEVSLSINFILPYIESFLKESGQEALAMIAPQEDFRTTDRIQKTIKKRAELFAETVNNTTLEKLDRTLAEGISAAEGIKDLTDRVEAVYEDFPTYRSELIARTEATAANNEGMLEGYRQSEVATGKEWINAGDSRVRDEHENGIGVGGEIVGLDEKFSNGLPYPSEFNCRCVIGPAFLE
jgi:SPP1 gp7 family putative phage head morphogenesis protein